MQHERSVEAARKLETPKYLNGMGVHNKFSGDHRTAQPCVRNFTLNKVS